MSVNTLQMWLILKEQSDQGYQLFLIDFNLLFLRSGLLSTLPNLAVDFRPVGLCPVGFCPNGL